MFLLLGMYIELFRICIQLWIIDLKLLQKIGVIIEANINAFYIWIEKIQDVYNFILSIFLYV